MSRYIDADALIRNLQERYCRPCKASGLDYNGVKCKACPLDDEIDDIDGFADNSIDIVFCKECRWSKWCRNNGEFYLWCRPNIKRIKENGFCNCGKRRKL